MSWELLKSRKPLEVSYLAHSVKCRCGNNSDLRSEKLKPMMVEKGLSGIVTEPDL